MQGVDPADVPGEVLPSVPSVSVSLCVDLNTQRREAEDAGVALLVVAPVELVRLEGLGVGELPGLGEYFSHPPVRLLAFLLPLGIELGFGRCRRRHGRHLVRGCQ